MKGSESTPGLVLLHTLLWCRNGVSDKEYAVTCTQYSDPVKSGSAEIYCTYARYGPRQDWARSFQEKYCGPDKNAALSEAQKTIAAKLRPHGGTVYTELLCAEHRDSQRLFQDLATLRALVPKAHALDVDILKSALLDQVHIGAGVLVPDHKPNPDVLIPTGFWSSAAEVIGVARAAGLDALYQEALMRRARPKRRASVGIIEGGL